MDNLPKGEPYIKMGVKGRYIYERRCLEKVMVWKSDMVCFVFNRTTKKVRCLLLCGVRVYVG